MAHVWLRKINFYKFNVEFVRLFNMRVIALMNQETNEELRKFVEEFDHCFEILNSELLGL